MAFLTLCLALAMMPAPGMALALDEALPGALETTQEQPAVADEDVAPAENAEDPEDEAATEVVDEDADVADDEAEDEGEPTEAEGDAETDVEAPETEGTETEPTDGAEPEAQADPAVDADAESTEPADTDPEATSAEAYPAASEKNVPAEPRIFTVTAPSDVTYDGKQHKQPVLVTDEALPDADPLLEGTDYALTYEGDLTNAGEVTITVEGLGAYAGTTVTCTYRILPAPQASVPTPVPASKNQTLDADAHTITGPYDGTAQTVSATSDDPDATFEYGTASVDALDPTALATIAADPTETAAALAGTLPAIDPASILDHVTWSTTAPSLVNAGVVPFVIRAHRDNYEPALSDVWALVVRPRVVTLTSDSATKTFDGTELTAPNVTVGGEGWAEGEEVAYDFTGTQTAVGTSQNTFTYILPATEKNPLPLPTAEVMALVGKLLEALGSTDLEAEVQALVDELAQASDAAAAEAILRELATKLAAIASAADAEPEARALLSKLAELAAAGPSNYLVTVEYGTLEVTAPVVVPVAPTPSTAVPVVPLVAASAPSAPSVPAALAAVPTLAPAPVLPELVEKPTSKVPEEPVAEVAAAVTDPGLESVLAELGDVDHWSAANLAAAVASAALSTLALLGQIASAKQEEGKPAGRSASASGKWVGSILTVVPAVAAIASFVLTGDLSKPMQMFDHWTPLLVVLLAMQALTLVLTREQEEDDFNDDAMA